MKKGNAAKSATETTLIAEYQAAVSLLGSLDTRIWSVYSVVTTIAVGALVISAQKDMPTAASIALGVGVGVQLLSWWLLASRWWSYGDLILVRLRDIEKTLHGELALRLKWHSALLSRQQVKQLHSAEKAAYHAVRDHTPEPAFPRMSQRKASLISVVGLFLTHVGLIITAVLK